MSALRLHAASITADRIPKSKLSFELRCHRKNLARQIGSLGSPRSLPPRKTAQDRGHGHRSLGRTIRWPILHRRHPGALRGNQAANSSGETGRIAELGRPRAGRFPAVAASSRARRADGAAGPRRGADRPAARRRQAALRRHPGLDRQDPAVHRQEAGRRRRLRPGWQLRPGRHRRRRRRAAADQDRRADDLRREAALPHQVASSRRRTSTTG